MISFKGEHLNYKCTKGEIPNTIYGVSPQGWIDHELIADWLLKLFVKNIPFKLIQFFEKSRSLLPF